MPKLAGGISVHSDTSTSSVVKVCEKYKVMSEEDIALMKIDETSQRYTIAGNSDESSNLTYNSKLKDNEDEKSPFLRFPSIRPKWKPKFSKVRNRLRKMSCFKGSEDEEKPMLEVPRHKSIDIGVGLARRVSLFIFTRRSVCVHPYHPYTPAQTTRKILIHVEDG